MDRDKEDRVWFSFTGAQLKEYFGKRALWYEGRAERLKAIAAKMPKAQEERDEEQPEEAASFYSNKTVQAAERSLEQTAKDAERHARRFRLLEKHVDTTQTFKLTEQEINIFELTSAL